jgi:phosphopantetheine adenylyltransferase
MCAQSKCTATGFAILHGGERRLLTNAHATADQVMVQVRRERF